MRKQVDSPDSRAEELRLNKLREKLDELIESDPRLKALRPHLLINMMDEGLRIQIIDSQNRPMFKTGSAQVESYMRDILRAIAPILTTCRTRSACPATPMISLTPPASAATATGNCRPIAPTPPGAS